MGDHAPLSHVPGSSPHCRVLANSTEDTRISDPAASLQICSLRTQITVQYAAMY